MAYCIHITRKHLPDNKDISLKEWESLVIQYPEMELQSPIVGENQQSENTIEISGNGSAVWSRGDRVTYFTFYDGVISTSETDPAVEQHMHYLAFYLKAEIRGDEGEAYSASELVKEQLGQLTVQKSQTPIPFITKVDNAARKLNKIMDKGLFKVTFWGVVILLILVKVLWIDS